MHIPSLQSFTGLSPLWRRRLILAGVAALVLLIGVALLYSRYFGPVDTSAPRIEFIVEPEETFEEVAQELRREGLIRSMTAFRIAYARTGNLRGIREGGYQISASMDTLAIAKALAAPPYLAWVTFPPGYRKEQIGELLARKLGWTPEEVASWVSVDTAPSLAFTEGVYYGDTYLIPSDQSPAQVAARLRGRFMDVTKEYAQDAQQKGMDWTDVLIMASLIEREAAKDDKALIAGILWNRIDDGMALQVDATLQYIRGASGNWWPVPESEDKKLDSPFNTYKYRGLPPHPIANPSLESIEAALNPTRTNCIYYIHDTNGEIHCSATYAGQRANVNRYLK